MKRNAFMSRLFNRCNGFPNIKQDSNLLVFLLVFRKRNVPVAFQILKHVAVVVREQQIFMDTDCLYLFKALN